MPELVSCKTKNSKRVRGVIARVCLHSTVAPEVPWAIGSDFGKMTIKYLIYRLH